MKQLVLAIAILTLASCSSDFSEKPASRPEVKELHPAGQVAAILEGPLTWLGVAAFIWALNGVPLFKFTSNKVTKKGGEP